MRTARETLDVLVETGDYINQIKHAYSHFSIIMDAYHCELVAGHPQALGYDDFRWIYPYEVEQFAFHGAIHKLFNNIDGAVIV